MKESFNINYNGVDIPFVTDFKSGDPTIVNATKMLWCFPEKGRNNGISHFLSNQSTQDYINALSRVTGIPASELLKVKPGNAPVSGTWMHEDLAMEFARWLNPEFAMWCNKQIRLLFHNRAIYLQNQINQVRQKRIDLEQRCNKMHPYAVTAYNILNVSKMTYSTTDIVKGFSCTVSVPEVFARLEAENFITRSDKGWKLKAPFDNQGYTTVVSTIVHKNGKPCRTNPQVKWTEQGRQWLGSILRGWGVISFPPQTSNP